MQDADDIAELVEGLRAHIDDLPAALATCQALARVLRIFETEKAAAMIQAGGIEAVLAAGAKHAGSAQVAEQVCWVLKNLATSGSQKDEAPPRRCNMCVGEPLATHVCDDCDEAMCQVGDI